jgi:hypothetical protein
MFSKPYRGRYLGDLAARQLHLDDLTARLVGVLAVPPLVTLNAPFGAEYLVAAHD